MESKVRFESENYYFQVYGFSLKEEFRCPEKVGEAVTALDTLFNFKVTEIMSHDDSGIPVRHYRYDYSKPLPPDVDNEMILVQCRYNMDYTTRFLFSPGPHADAKSLYATLSHFFTIGTGQELADFKVYGSIRGQHPAITKLRKNKKYGNQFSMPHQNAYGSKIEETLSEALSKHNIPFKKQQEIFYQSALLTVLDFYIESGKIAIYCDGFQYHYDKETVIKDRKQDRILQLLGHKVLRFTGSEIVGDLNRCLEEIKIFVKKFS